MYVVERSKMLKQSTAWLMTLRRVHCTREIWRENHVYLAIFAKRTRRIAHSGTASFLILPHHKKNYSSPSSGLQLLVWRRFRKRLCMDWVDFAPSHSFLCTNKVHRGQTSGAVYRVISRNFNHREVET